MFETNDDVSLLCALSVLYTGPYSVAPSHFLDLVMACHQIVINTTMSTLVKTLNVFLMEATLVNRERAEGSDGVRPYFMSKICAELPIVPAFVLVFNAFVYPMAGLSGGVGRTLIIEHTILLQIPTSNIEHLTSLILLEN